MGFDLTTFLFELVNFGLLLWILERVLYRPLRAGIERRRDALASEQERAAEEQRVAQSIRVEAETRLAEIEKLRESVVADAREQAAKEEARILEGAREDAAVERERVQRTLERERDEALAWIRQAAVDNSVEIAGRLLDDLLPESADGVLMEALIASVEEQRPLLENELEIAMEHDGHVTVELSMPRSPPPELLARLRQVLADISSVECDWVTRVDESLLAGPVLRVGDRVLDASVAGHLAVLRERARALAEEGTRDA